MNKTRKSLMTAGSIISFILAGILIITSLVIFGMSSAIDLELVREVVAEMPEYSGFTDEELVALVQIVKVMYIMLGLYLLVLSVATIPVAIRVLKNTSNNKKGAIIALLVLSIFTANILTLAFMIVALCLKNKPVEINESTNNDDQIKTITIN